MTPPRGSPKGQRAGRAGRRAPRYGATSWPSRDDTAMPRAVLCLPTYNERENLEQMIEALGSVLDTTIDRVLVIDDGSPDGTGEIADRLASELPWVAVLHREAKQGIGPAYVAGFRWALAEGAGLVLEMDCDFSHDPADVPRLFATARAGSSASGARRSRRSTWTRCRHMGMHSRSRPRTA